MPSATNAESFHTEADIISYLATHQFRLESLTKRFPLECVFPMCPTTTDTSEKYHIRFVLRDENHLHRIIESGDFRTP